MFRYKTKNFFITAMMNYLIRGLQMSLLLGHTDLDIALLPEIFRKYLDIIDVQEGIMWFFNIFLLSLEAPAWQSHGRDTWLCLAC